ncbi:MAG: sulfite exporter TauE/SafE family protein [Bacteroidales bacterium]|nr:sulfite exporter TauE/SafE family protein [Bacteroidales bacterium]
MEYFEILKEGGFPLLSAFIMGLVVIACPCTIASNVTILTSMLNKNVSASVLFSKASIYVLGRMVAYMGIAYLLYSFSEIIAISESIQKILGLLLGPLFLLVGILMLDIVHIHGLENKCLIWMKKWTLSDRLVGPFLLGLAFAFAFCPYGALIYFGMMIPLSITSVNGLWVPLSFSIGTALPILLVALLFFWGWDSKKHLLSKFQTFELWLRRILAVFFIISGILFILEFYL